MGLMDNMDDKFGGSMRDRYEELKTKAQAGQLDESSKAEYEQLKEHFDKQ